MKYKITVVLMGLIVLVIMGISPSPTQSARSVDEFVVTKASSTIPALAPWYRKKVESSLLDEGLYVSVALDNSGTPYVSYYEANHKDLRMAKYVGAGGNCGTNNFWSCETVDRVRVMLGSTVPLP